MYDPSEEMRNFPHSDSKLMLASEDSCRVESTVGSSTIPEVPHSVRPSAHLNDLTSKSTRSSTSSQIGRSDLVQGLWYMSGLLAVIAFLWELCARLGTCCCWEGLLWEPLQEVVWSRQDYGSGELDTHCQRCISCWAKHSPLAPSCMSIEGKITDSCISVFSFCTRLNATYGLKIPLNSMRLTGI